MSIASKPTENIHAEGCTISGLHKSYGDVEVLKGIDLDVEPGQVVCLIGPSGSAAQGLEALRGKQVGVPMPGNMPDLVFRYLLGQKGWSADSDLTITPYPDGQGALNALLTRERAAGKRPRVLAHVYPHSSHHFLLREWLGKQPAGFPELSEVKAPDVDLNDLDDLQTTIQMIQEAGLL